MPELDPRSASRVFGVPEIVGQIAYLPPRIYEFGFLPDITKMLPGDLILVSAIKPGISGRLIKTSQEMLFASGCDWTHAAIYIGDYTIIEANPFKGIHKNVLFRYVIDYRICVRRLRKIGDVPAEQAYAAGLELALDAALRMPRSLYPLRWLLAFVQTCLAKPIAKFNINRHIRFANHHVCSSLFAACVMDTHGVSVTGSDYLSRSLNVCPAMLRHSAQLVDVDVGWAPLANPDGVNIAVEHAKDHRTEKSEVVRCIFVLVLLIVGALTILIY